MIESQERPAEDRLTAEYAAERGARVSDVRYALEFTLEETPERFSGRADIRFDLAHAANSLTLDFSEGDVSAVRINGEDATVDYNGAFVRLPAESLVPGDNRVQIEFGHDYSRTGQGLHRFEDPEDGRVYIHTHFEPYDANRLFPGFDQPDLKARFTLEVSAPAAWHIVSASRESAIETEGERRRWHFPETRPISTYIFPLHAGEYRVWESQAGDIPLRLYARESLARYVQPDDWFDLTRRGFAFFQDYFDLPYPYGKYDQLIVPEFNIGGMENVAAVTYTEAYISRGRYTRQHMEQLSNTLLHELSHMWFGDLVTPVWWDGLWLKEAFATYMGYLSEAEATPYDDAWHLFFVSAKQRAYIADQLVTTHPIQVPVGDTRYAFANFDDITYRKGSSVLTQLSYFVGQEAFRNGVRAYLRDFADGATELKDFIAALEGSSGLDLGGWVADWLETPGVNTLAPQIRCSGGKIESLLLNQRAPAEFPVLRDHRIQVGLYRFEEGELVADVLPVNVSDEQTAVTAAVGLPCPTLVYPNHGDWGFVKIALDEATLAALGERLPQIGDPMLRSMFWASLWDMVRDAELELDVYLDRVLEGLPGERSDKVVLQMTGNIGVALSYLWGLPDDQAGLLENYGARLESMVFDEALAAAPGSDLQTLWADAYRRIAHTPTAFGRLQALLAGDEVFPGYAVDQDRRWWLLFREIALGASDIEERIAAELERDPSDNGEAAALGAWASQPSQDAKREWLDRVRDPDNGLSLSRRRMIMSSLFPAFQARLHDAFADDILNTLTAVGETHQDPFLSSYGQLIPRSCSAASVARLAAAIDASSDLHPILMKALRIAHQEDARCMAISDRLRQTGTTP